MSRWQGWLMVPGAMLVSVGSHAESRYQAIPINAGADFGTEKALVLDTVEGHLWIWTESPASDDRSGGRYVIYQGQLFPGREVGDVVLKQEWTMPAEPASDTAKP